MPVSSSPPPPPPLLINPSSCLHPTRSGLLSSSSFFLRSPRLLLLLLSLPTFPFRDAFITLSVCPLCHPRVGACTHTHAHTHTLAHCPLVSHQPEPHLTLVNSAIEGLLIYAYRCSVCVFVWVCVCVALLFTLLNVTCLLGSQVPHRVCVFVRKSKSDCCVHAACLCVHVCMCVCMCTCQACVIEMERVLQACSSAFIIIHTPM